MEFIEEITPTGGNATILANSTVAHDQEVRHKGWWLQVVTWKIEECYQRLYL